MAETNTAELFKKLHDVQKKTLTALVEIDNTALLAAQQRCDALNAMKESYGIQPGQSDVGFDAVTVSSREAQEAVNTLTESLKRNSNRLSVLEGTENPASQGRITP